MARHRNPSRSRLRVGRRLAAIAVLFALVAAVAVIRHRRMAESAREFDATYGLD